MSQRTLLACAAFLLSGPRFGLAQPAQSRAVTPEQIQALVERLEAQDERIQQLESRLQQLSPVVSQGKAISTPIAAASPTPIPVESLIEPKPDIETDGQIDMGGHSMELPGGGPTLKIRGFFDLNYDIGSDANPLIFPLGTHSHSSFQAGEFDLFLSSRLSDKLSFVSEIIIGSDPTNYWGLDIERAQLTYRRSEYFEISGGRYHTSIGYYNTAFHHGTWFQTATGRPFMYFFEDSGGILPTHGMGVTATGLVPHTGQLDLHWSAELSNGRSSSSTGQAVQNFLSDRNGKAFNFAAFVRPQWVPGLQVGGSYYHDRLYLQGAGAVNQSIGSAYAVYSTPQWEFLNEAVVLSNHQEGSTRAHVTPLVYTQLARKFGRYHPYVRYQYVNSPATDPVNTFVGRYDGPSLGIRTDLADYAAFKIQYNRLYQGPRIMPANGLNMQMAFSF